MATKDDIYSSVEMMSSKLAMLAIKIKETDTTVSNLGYLVSDNSKTIKNSTSDVLSKLGNVDSEVAFINASMVTVKESQTALYDEVFGLKKTMATLLESMEEIKNAIVVLSSLEKKAAVTAVQAPALKPLPPVSEIKTSAYEDGCILTGDIISAAKSLRDRYGTKNGYAETLGLQECKEVMDARKFALGLAKAVAAAKSAESGMKPIPSSAPFDPYNPFPINEVELNSLMTKGGSAAAQLYHARIGNKVSLAEATDVMKTIWENFNNGTSLSNALQYMQKNGFAGLNGNKWFNSPLPC